MLGKNSRAGARTAALLLSFALVLTGAYALSASKGRTTPQTANPGDSLAFEDRNRPDSGRKSEDEFTKTYTGAEITELDISVNLSELVIEKSPDNTFHAEFSYPANRSDKADRYKELYTLDVNPAGDTLEITLKFDGRSAPHNNTENLEGILTVQIPERRYESVKLQLSVSEAELDTFDIDTRDLTVLAEVSDLSLKTGRVFENLRVSADVSDVKIRLDTLGPNTEFDIRVSECELILASEPQNLDLSVYGSITSDYRLPRGWNAVTNKNDAFYKRGDGSQKLTVNNSSVGDFKVKTEK